MLVTLHIGYAAVLAATDGQEYTESHLVIGVLKWLYSENNDYLIS